MEADDYQFRPEEEVFQDLSDLCISDGYVHALAALCFRDNTLHFGQGELTANDVQRQYGPERLIRTEISTLLGMMIKTPINDTHPGSKVIQEYIDKTEALLIDLHNSLNQNIHDQFSSGKAFEEGYDPFSDGRNLREPIFYAGESAYNFQFRDLVTTRYKNDNAWLAANKGFDIKTAREIVHVVEKIQNRNASKIPELFLRTHPNDWTPLHAFTFSLEEVTEETGLEEAVVNSVLNEFCAPNGPTNDKFNAIGDFNLVDAYPLIRLRNQRFLLFLSYTLTQALYENPFFWFKDDKDYSETALKHRGEYTESLSEEFLTRVFGKDRVWKNVTILNNKGETIGEIDVLVVFGKRALVIQAKSKRLTVEARKGNDNILRDDFKKAIQSSYEQGFNCAELLIEGTYLLACPNRNAPQISPGTEFFILCIISDHYPALSFQSRFFLQLASHPQIRPPFVLDVFLLDVLAEFLNSPLYFLSYLDRRVTYADRVLVNHEFTTLSYHLRRNLWFDNDVSMIHLGDDITAELDSALMVRREGLPGADTPEGILTKYKGTTAERIISQIENTENPAAIDLGLLLLQLSEDTINQTSEAIDHLAMLWKKDGNSHDFTMGFDDSKAGICIHCNLDGFDAAQHRLRDHVERRKYAHQARTWFGVCLDPINFSIRLAVKADFEWEYSEELANATKDMPKITKKLNLKTVTRHRRKIGRNEPCPCGSGKKYKRCCL